MFDVPFFWTMHVALFRFPARLVLSRQKLAGVHDAGRIERRLDPPLEREPRRLGGTRQRIALHLADTVLGRDRPAGDGDAVVDAVGDQRAGLLHPAGVGTGWGDDVEVDVA